MIADLKSIKCIEDIPFAGIMWQTDTCPVLFDFLVQGMDLVIWKMRPSVREPKTTELRQAALRTLGSAIENQGIEPGVAIYELDGYSFFAFPSSRREQVMAEMGILEVTAWEHSQH